jgi:hypothetical protein
MSLILAIWTIEQMCIVWQIMDIISKWFHVLYITVVYTNIKMFTKMFHYKGHWRHWNLVTDSFNNFVSISIVQIAKIKDMNYSLTKCTTIFVLKNYFFCSFRIDDLASQKMFMIDMKFSLCLEASNPNQCVFKSNIFTNLRLYKPACTSNMGFRLQS